MSIGGSIGALLLIRTHMLCLFVWCWLDVFVLSCFGPTGQLDSSEFLCRTFHCYRVGCTMDDSYGGWSNKGEL